MMRSGVRRTGAGRNRPWWGGAAHVEWVGRACGWSAGRGETHVDRGIGAERALGGVCCCSAAGGGGGIAAKDAAGNDVKASAWLTTHLAGDRSLTQGLKVRIRPCRAPRAIARTSRPLSHHPQPSSAHAAPLRPAGRSHHPETSPPASLGARLHHRRSRRTLPSTGVPSVDSLCTHSAA